MENNYQKFEQNIANEITIEAKDQMPDAYRKTLIRQIGQHGHSEIVVCCLKETGLLVHQL